jgi:hypothetical protein
MALAVSYSFDEVFNNIKYNFYQYVYLLTSIIVNTVIN